jgi:long-subunit fatty acid transport protein
VQESYSASYTLTHRLARGWAASPTVNWNFIRDIGTEGSGEATHLIRLGFSLGGSLTDRIGANLNYFYQTRMSNLPEESYNAHQVNLSLSHRFDSQLSGNLGCTFEMRESESAPEENYNETKITAGLSRALTRRISSSLTYTFTLRNSRIADDSYNENQIAFSLGYSF